MKKTTQKSVSKNGIFVALLIGAVTSSLLQTALTTALPAIMSDFRIDAAAGQWLTSVYTLAMGIMIPVSPFLLRRFKTKVVSLSVIGVVIIGTVLAAVSVNFPMLLVGRILQGLATGVLLSLVQVVILTIYPVEKRGSMMGIYGLAVCAAPVVAPTLTGVLIDMVSWRAIFIIGLAVLIFDGLLLAFTMRDVLPNEYQQFDIFSMAACTIGFGGILLGCGNLGRYPFFSANVALPLLAGILFLVVFIFRQFKLDTAFLELRIFKNRTFALAVVMSMLNYCVLTASSTLLPIYLQVVHGFTATLCGLIMMPGSLVSALINPLSGKIYDRFGIRRLVVTGSLLSAVSYLLIALLNESTPLPLIIAIFVIQMIGIGCIMMPLVTWGMSTLEEKYISDGTATLNMFRTIAGAIGSALFVAVMTYVTKATSGSVAVTANVPGMHVTYLGIFVISIAQCILALFLVGKKSKKHEVRDLSKKTN